MTPPTATGDVGSAVRRVDPAGSRRHDAVLRTAVEPVTTYLLGAARRQAEQAVETAKVRHDRTVADAKSEAARMIAAARAEGAAAAERNGKVALALATRRAQELVMSARGRAFASLRRTAIEALAAAAGTVEGVRLAGHLAERARQQVASAPMRPARGTATAADEDFRVEAHDMTIEVVHGHRRVAVDAAALVDFALASMPDEVERLWG